MAARAGVGAVGEIGELCFVACLNVLHFLKSLVSFFHTVLLTSTESSRLISPF